MESKVMERLRPIMDASDAIILAIMALFTFLKQSINESGPFQWKKAFIKVFTNFVAGWGFYSLILAYDSWFGDYPQKVGVIMIVVYAGSRLIDIVVDAIYNIDIKAWLRKWLNG